MEKRWTVEGWVAERICGAIINLGGFFHLGPRGRWSLETQGGRLELEENEVTVLRTGEPDSLLDDLVEFLG